jgi:hypothetical protein
MMAEKVEYPPGAIRSKRKLREAVWAVLPIKEPGPHKVLKKHRYGLLISNYPVGNDPGGWNWFADEDALIRCGGNDDWADTGFLFTNFWYA